jgi:protein TonB
MPYRTDRRDRTKALGLVLGVHAALALALIAGLRGPAMVREAEERLASFDVSLPPPPSPPPAQAPDEAARDEAGAPDLAARPAEIVALPQQLPLPSPVRTAEEAAPVPGPDATAGAAQVFGPGNGSGGRGSGFGAGGAGQGGTGSGGGMASGARWLGGGLSRGDYRNIRAFDVPSGTAAFSIAVAADGSATGCRPAQSSGSPALDAAICALVVPRMRFAPARDANGRPVPDQVTYVANWTRR